MAFTIRPSCEPPTAIELRQAVVALGIHFDSLPDSREMMAKIIEDLAYNDKLYCVIGADRELVLIGSALFARALI